MAKYDNRPYSFRRNDVTEAAKLYYMMKNYPRYRTEAGFGGIYDVDTPVLSRSGSNSSRRGSRRGSRTTSSSPISLVLMSATEAVEEVVEEVVVLLLVAL